MTKKELTDLIYKINGCAINVHRFLGPGLLESTYQKCLIVELKQKKFDVKSEVSIPIVYNGVNVDAHLRCDLIINNILVVELKSVEKILPIHKAQILTYMKLLGLPIGLIINFNVNNIFYEGQKTFVNELYRALED